MEAMYESRALSWGNFNFYARTSIIAPILFFNFTRVHT